MDEGIRVARKRLLQMHFESGVGHIGGNLSCLDALVLLHRERLAESDRFILSKGHAAGALYVALWSVGKLRDSDLSQFHRDDTLLPGHPPPSGVDGVLFATGSLGHGLSLAAGTALALKLQKAKGQVYCLTSDGEWQEGSTWEALIFAAHRRLANLTVLIDHNQLQGFGRTDAVASMSPLWSKLAGFDVDLSIVDGHDLSAIRTALDRESSTLRIIVLETRKGNGVSFMQDRMEWHYLPMQADQYRQAVEDIDNLWSDGDAQS